MWFLLGLALADEPTAANCIACHPEEGAQWHSSRHSVSLTNALFQADYAAESLPLCLDCHAPDGTDEGVSCVTCHVDSGQIRSLTVSGTAPHPSRVDPELNRSSFCARCHDFNFTAVHPGGTLAWTDTPMQATFQEWVAWGGEESCQDCHMKQGHDFSGAHSPALLTEAISVEAKGHELRITSLGVGHAAPTGDLFRHMTLQVRVAGEAWVVAGWIGRRYTAVFDVARGDYVPELVSDTRLHPGETVTVVVPDAMSAWRLVYHYTLEHEPSLVLHSGSL